MGVFLFPNVSTRVETFNQLRLDVFLWYNLSMASKKVLIKILIFSLIILGIFLYLFFKVTDAGDTNILNDINNKITRDKTILAITPHHMVAEKMIEEVFTELKDEDFDRVFLLSPNHFGVGTSFLQTSDITHQTSFGKVNPDFFWIEKLKNEDFASIENMSFKGEHGIEGITPFISKYFPNANIVPLLIGDGIAAERIDGLADLLSGDISGNNLILLSADFSHYLTNPIAQFHDKFSREIIQSKKYKEAIKADIDCPAGLRLILKIAADKKLKFNFVNNSNAALLAGDNFAIEPTSYITGFFDKEGDDVLRKELNLSFFGDLMLDRSVRTHIDRSGIEDIFSDSKRLFLGNHQNVANLEGVLASDIQTISVGTTPEQWEHYKFVFNSENIQFFKNNGFGTLNLGNNHIENFGEDGIQKTIDNLNRTDIKSFGNPKEKDNYLIQEINGVKYATIGYNKFKSGDLEKALEQITHLKKTADLIIVYAHWGDEYEDRPNENQIQIARQFIDEGADTIIGSHPHVIQSIEKYEGKYIFYSLGNFIFDQFFSLRTQHGLSVGINYEKNKNNLVFYLAPFEMGSDFKMNILQGEELREELNFISGISNLSEREIDMVRKGILW